MKVTEKGTNRTAYAHIYVDGRVNPLEEYGEYFDTRDNAVCCYVPVEEGHKIKINGRFSGLTLSVAYDVMVDGVCRKANSYVGKTVQFQKNKRLDFDSFLIQTSDGIIDTDMSVSTYSAPSRLDKTMSETIGVIELRVYITRQFGIEHDITDDKFDSVEDSANDNPQSITHKDIPPHFQMVFEKNCSTLDGFKATREKKKVSAKRPGKEPWTIFRFHYRSKVAIIEQKMGLTFDQTNKALNKAEPRVLELESVPLLLIGAKPAGKNDGESSVRTSSPPPPETPKTPTKPTKSSLKNQSTQPKVLIRKAQTKPTATKTSSTSDMDTALASDSSAFPVPPVDITPNKLNRSGSQPSSTATQNTKPGVTAKLTANKISDELTPATEKKSDSIAEVLKEVGKKPVKKAPESNPKVPGSTDTVTENYSKGLEKPNEKSDDKLQLKLADATAQPLSEETSKEPVIMQPSHLLCGIDSPSVSSTTDDQLSLFNAKDFIKSGLQPFTSPVKKAATKPTAFDTNASMVLKKPVNPPAPATPIKRPLEGTLTPPPDMKRIKTDSIASLTPTLSSRHSSASPSPRPLSMEAQVAEQRKRLETARKRRVEMARKKAAVDERMAPYKQRMAEELERLRQEVAAEEMMAAEDEQEYKATAAMLAEFERADGED